MSAGLICRGGRERLAALDSLLEGAYHAPEDALANKSDPLDESIYIILSFQTDLARFSSVWTKLRAAFPSWDKLERARVGTIARVLREGGLHFQKARTLKRLLKAVREHAGVLTLNFLREMDGASAERFLTRLPGLSWKGARCVLLYSLDRSVLPVDGNTFRVLKRAGVLDPTAVYRRRNLHDELQALVPPERRRAFHVNLVVHGQKTCLPMAPKCSGCPARPACRMRGVDERKAKARSGHSRGALVSMR